MSILVSGLSFGYSTDAPVLKDVSIEFRAAELTFLTGASGSGKTTLMRCINGLIPHRCAHGIISGCVIIAGHPVRSLTLLEISAHVGTVMQDPERQMVATTAMDEIAFGLENLALPRDRIRERVLRQAERLGIAHLLNRKIAKLSGGEKQKVAIAGVLVMEPCALLLDEPLASLDPSSSREAMSLFRELANSGVAVIVSEHRNNYVLQANPNHCVILEKGCVTFDGNSRDFPLKQPSGRRSFSPSEPSAPLLVAVENVWFRHLDGDWVLKNVNLQIRKGDIIALLGANGAGKSTVCRHLIGLHKPTKGRVLIEGDDTREMTVAQIARKVGYVFQSPSAMLFEKTLRREIAFGPMNTGVITDANDKKVQTAAETMDLGGRLENSPLSFSFGEQKRASVASVLAMEPRVLVVDEPTAGQDHDHVLRLMNHLSQNSFDAIVLATHDLDLARDCANRCMVISGGEIIADGEPDQVLSDQCLMARCRLL